MVGRGRETQRQSASEHCLPAKESGGGGRCAQLGSDNASAVGAAGIKHRLGPHFQVQDFAEHQMHFDSIFLGNGSDVRALTQRHLNSPPHAEHSHCSLCFWGLFHASSLRRPSSLLHVGLGSPQGPSSVGSWRQACVEPGPAFSPGKELALVFWLLLFLCADQSLSLSHSADLQKAPCLALSFIQTRGSWSLLSRGFQPLTPRSAFTADAKELSRAQTEPCSSTACTHQQQGPR